MLEQVDLTSIVHTSVVCQSTFRTDEELTSCFTTEIQKTSVVTDHINLTSPLLLEEA